MTTWFTTTDEEALARLLVEWPDAPEERPETLGFLLDTARTQVIAYAQGLPDDAVLADYKLLDEDTRTARRSPTFPRGSCTCSSGRRWSSGTR